PLEDIRVGARSNRAGHRCLKSTQCGRILHKAHIQVVFERPIAQCTGGIVDHYNRSSFSPRLLCECLLQDTQQHTIDVVWDHGFVAHWATSCHRVPIATASDSPAVIEAKWPLKSARASSASSNPTVTVAA